MISHIVAGAICLCLGALVGLLVGRRNNKLADQANTAAERALAAVNKKP